MKLVGKIFLTLAALLITLCATAAPNPLALAYNSTSNVVNYAAPTLVIIAGRTNRVDAAFQKAREKGAEVLPYFNVVERPDTKVSSLDEEFYMGDHTKVPLWPYPTPGARWIFDQQHHMTDIRIGSPWVEYALDYLSEVMRAGQFDGLFLDVIGGRLWGGNVNWENWPDWEKAEWQAGVKDFMRRLDERRRQINPGLKIVNNNTWQHNLDCEAYVDGIMLEHIKPSNTYTVEYASHAYSDLGHKRVLVISNNGDDQFWKGVVGVTHIGTTPGGYGAAQPPVMPYSDIVQAELSQQLQASEQARKVAEIRLQRINSISAGGER